MLTDRGWLQQNRSTEEKRIVLQERFESFVWTLMLWRVFMTESTSAFAGQKHPVAQTLLHDACSCIQTPGWCQKGSLWNAFIVCCSFCQQMLPELRCDTFRVNRRTRLIHNADVWRLPFNRQVISVMLLLHPQHYVINCLVQNSAHTPRREHSLFSLLVFFPCWLCMYC